MPTRYKNYKNPPDIADDPSFTLEQGKQGDFDNPAGNEVAEGIFAEDLGSEDEEPNALPPDPSIEVADENGEVHAFSAGGAPSFEIIWKGSPNFWPGRVGAAPKAIVNHIMQSSLDSATGWFMNPQAEASSHFGIGKDGRVIQYVRLENSAWANGPVNKPDHSLDWLMDAVNNKINPNRLTVSIEHEGRTGEEFPEAQYQATLFVHKKIIQQFGIPIDRFHIIGHYQIDAVNRPMCPGKAFPWNRLIADLQAAFAPPAPAPVAEPAPEPALAQAVEVAASPAPEAAPEPAPAPVTDSAPPAAMPDPPGYNAVDFGPGQVAIPNAYVRAYPSFGPDGRVLGKVLLGTSLNFSGYTDEGPSFQGSTRWYRLTDADGGGWIHAKMIG